MRLEHVKGSSCYPWRFRPRLATHATTSRYASLVRIGRRCWTVPGTNLADIEWYLDEPRPELFDSSSITILDVNDGNLAQDLKNRNVTAVFSALPSEPASRIEAELVSAGLHVFSNASAFRMHPEA